MEFSTLTGITFALQLALGLVFALSVGPMLLHPSAFVRDVLAFEILPTAGVKYFVVVVIALETLLSAAFLTGVMILLALPLATVLLLTFLIAVGINLRRGRAISCGCFGDVSEQISRRTVVRIWLLIATILVVSASRALGSASKVVIVEMSPTDLLQTVSLTAFFLLLGSWMLSLPELLVLGRRMHSNDP